MTAMISMPVDDDKNDPIVPVPPAGAVEVSHDHGNSESNTKNPEYGPQSNRTQVESNPIPQTSAREVDAR